MTEEEKQNMTTAELEIETELEEPDTPDAPDLEDDEDDGDGDEQGWLAIWVDGEQQVFEHPEDKTEDEILTAWVEAKRKAHHYFRIGKSVIDPTYVRFFGWAEESLFPELEKFDSLQQRLETLAETQAILQVQQAQLQQAQAQSYQVEEELEDLPAAPAPQLATRPGAKKKFRPPV